MGNIFWQSFIGQEPLATAFWKIYFLNNILIHACLAIVVAAFLIYNQTPVSTSIFTQFIACKIVLTAAFPYTLYSAVAVWRCSQDSALIWRLLARLIVVTHVIVIFIII